MTYEDDLDRVAGRVQQLCAQSRVSGVAVALVRDARLVWAEAFGDLDLHTPLPVASLSKPLFAYAVLKLSERGVLDLDRPLADYLPFSYLPDEPCLPLMTARHALSHTTGFPNWRDAAGLQANSHPGSAFYYSTEGVLYLQAVVEHLVGQPLDEFMSAHILAPFGMAASCLGPDDLSAFLPFLPRGARAYGGLSLRTTAPDYARFLAEMMRDGDGDESHLSQPLLRQMLAPQVVVGDQRQLSWGLGWGLQHEAGEEDSFWHWGARSKLTRSVAMGYRARRCGVVILTGQVDGLSLCEEVAQVALAHSGPFPAFRWLLPVERWRADGRAESDMPSKGQPAGG